MYWIGMIHFTNKKMNKMINNNKTMKRNVFQIMNINKKILTETLQNPSKI